MNPKVCEHKKNQHEVAGNKKNSHFGVVKWVLWFFSVTGVTVSVFKGQTEMGQGVPGLQDSSRGYHRPSGKEASRAAEGPVGKPSILDKKDKHKVCNLLFPKLLCCIASTSLIQFLQCFYKAKFSTQVK